MRLNIPYYQIDICISNTMQCVFIANENIEKILPKNIVKRCLNVVFNGIFNVNTTTA
jgi:hypothetical protein